MDADLPQDLVLRMDPGLRILDGSVVLMGGSPLRMVRLTPTGAALVESWASGAPIGPPGRHQQLARRLLDAGLMHPQPASSPYAPGDVAVVIPVRDRLQELTNLLSRLKAVGEVVVVDDGSAEPVPGAVLRHPNPRGPAAARNSGWAQTTCPLVAFVDSDCEPTAGWLEPLLGHFGDPEVAAVAPRIASSRACAGVLGRYEQARSPLDQGSLPGRVRPRSRIAYVPTAALVVRRTMLDAVGGFDEAMPYGEDVDWVWRVVRAGHTIRYEPQSVVIHPPRPHLRAWLQQRFRYGTSAAPLARRHPGALAPLAVSRWSFAAWLAVGLGWPKIGAAVAGATAAVLPSKLSGLRHPVIEGLRLAARGHLAAGRQVADAARRAWWPLALAAAVPSRRARRGLAFAATAPYVIEWAGQRPPLDPLRWTALRLLDDLAYGAGVWAGCLRERIADPLLADLSDWPGRRPAVEGASSGEAL